MSQTSTRPLRVTVHPDDNVAIVVNEGGLRAGTTFDDGLVLTADIPEAHKVALTDLPQGSPVIRYGVLIGTVNRNVPRGGWVHEGLLTLPAAPALSEVPWGGASIPQLGPLEGITFQGFRNEDGTVARATF